MEQIWFLFLHLRAAVLLLRGCSGSSSNSLHHLYLGVSEPIPGLPWFTQLGYVDDQLVTRYDSNTRRVDPQVPWMEKAEDAQYWEWETQQAQEAELYFRQALLTLQSRYKRSGGLHTWQCLVGCELSKDGKQKGRFMLCGYDGRDFIRLDKENFTWTAADEQAQLTKRKWEAGPTIKRIWKYYLENTCTERLQKYINNEKETLLRIESPTVKVACKLGHDGLETLVCRAHGFYPKEIDATWRKDGEVWEQETLRGGVSPNLDGTYHTWISTEIHPKDKKRYQCHVEHDSLLEPLNVTWVEPASVPVGAICGVVASILLMMTGIILFLKKRQIYSSTYRAVLARVQGLDRPFTPLEEGRQDASRASQEAASTGGPQQQEEGAHLLRRPKTWGLEKERKATGAMAKLQKASTVLKNPFPAWDRSGKKGFAFISCRLEQRLPSLQNHDICSGALCDCEGQSRGLEPLETDHGPTARRPRTLLHALRPQEPPLLKAQPDSSAPRKKTASQEEDRQLRGVSSIGPPPNVTLGFQPSLFPETGPLLFNLPVCPNNT
ncbi:class I histocompatibility antigen, F10 alpha chain-like [Hemicordylus capensis]|uniref:class I histocompatibility antigen, F10 alpha chain-like n=1 Tax=Hemicordylus capensis TaxID=884348 RepID=UPI002303BD23|nr:class I histocompatibility antigen, F10 alpha chain-like [Hemicordylus capensis]